MVSPPMAYYGGKTRLASKIAAFARTEVVWSNRPIKAQSAFDFEVGA